MNPLWAKCVSKIPIFSGKSKLALEVLAVGGAMLGALILSIDDSLMKYCYWIYLVSASTSLLLLVHDRNQRAQMMINLFYCCTNIFGISRVFIKTFL